MGNFFWSIQNFFFLGGGGGGQFLKILMVSDKTIHTQDSINKTQSRGGKNSLFIKTLVWLYPRKTFGDF